MLTSPRLYSAPQTVSTPHPRLLTPTPSKTPAEVEEDSQERAKNRLITAGLRQLALANLAAHSHILYAHCLGKWAGRRGRAYLNPYDEDVELAYCEYMAGEKSQDCVRRCMEMQNAYRVGFEELASSNAAKVVRANG